MKNRVYKYDDNRKKIVILENNQEVGGAFINFDENIAILKDIVYPPKIGEGIELSFNFINELINNSRECLKEKGIQKVVCGNILEIKDLDNCISKEIKKKSMVR